MSIESMASRPLSYGDLAVFTSSYPPNAPVYVNFLFEEDLADDLFIAPNKVGQSLARISTMPEDGIPLLPSNLGPHAVIGLFFALEGPILILRPVEMEEPFPG